MRALARALVICAANALHVTARPASTVSAPHLAAHTARAVAPEPQPSSGAEAVSAAAAAAIYDAHARCCGLATLALRSRHPFYA